MDGPAAPAGPHDQHGGLVPIADHVRPGPPRALQPGVHLDLRKERAAASAGWGGTEVGERERALSPHPDPSAALGGSAISSRIAAPNRRGVRRGFFPWWCECGGRIFFVIGRRRARASERRQAVCDTKEVDALVAPRRAQCLLPPLDSACGLCAGAGKVSDDDPPQAWPRSRPEGGRRSARPTPARAASEKKGGHNYQHFLNT